LARLYSSRFIMITEFHDFTASLLPRWTRADFLD